MRGDRRRVGLLIANLRRDTVRIGDEGQVVLHRFYLFLLQNSAVQLVAQTEGQENFADLAPVAIAQQIAAVAFERIVFENVGLRGQMGLRIEIDMEFIDRRL